MEMLADEDVCRDVAGTLGKMGPAAKSAVPALKKMLRDEDRPFAVLPLRPWDRSVRRRSRRFRRLAELLHDKDWQLGWDAADALGNMGPQRSPAR